MTQQRKTEIIRYEVVTANEGIKNQYGDLEFTDTMGNKHKIGNKRSGLFSAIIPGRAVKLGYATYMNKEYIASAELFDGTPQNPKQDAPQAKSTPPKEEIHTTTTPATVMTKEDWPEKDRVIRKSIERQTSLNAAVELAKKVEGVVSSEKIIATARVFEAYLEGKEVQKAGKLIEEAKRMGATEIEEGG